MSGYDRRNKCVFSLRRNTVNDEVDVMSSGRGPIRNLESLWSVALSAPVDSGIQWAWGMQITIHKRFLVHFEFT